MLHTNNSTAAEYSVNPRSRP